MTRQPDDPGVYREPAQQMQDYEDALSLDEILAIQDRRNSRFWRILWIMLAVGIAMVVWAASAEAHSWYPTRCCWSPQTAPSGRLGDCDAIPTVRVKEGPNGYEVSLVPGDHPMVKEPISFVVAYDDADVSLDGGYHVCFNSLMQVRCFFAGSRGS